MRTLYNISYAKCSLDSMGRILLPKAVRDQLDVRPGSTVELTYIGDDAYRLQAVCTTPHCFLCGSTLDLLTVQNKTICKSCAMQLVAKTK